MGVEMMVHVLNLSSSSLTFEQHPVNSEGDEAIIFEGSGQDGLPVRCLEDSFAVEPEQQQQLTASHTAIGELLSCLGVAAKLAQSAVL